MLTLKHFAAALVPLGLMGQPQAMTFALSGSGGNAIPDWVAAEGQITPDTPGKFEAFVKANGVGQVLYLNSPGGDLAAGIRLGELIRKYHYQTNVGATVPDGAWQTTAPGICASACAFAFLGGEIRSAAENEIGLHQFYNDVALRDPSAKLFDSLDLSAQQFVSALLIDYVFRMGADPRFVSLASATPPASVRWLTKVEAEELKVTWDPRKFEPWALQVYGKGAVALSKSYDRTRTASVFCRKDRVPKLLITDQSGHISMSSMEAAVGRLQGIEALGLDLSKDEVIARQVGGAVGFEVTLSGFSPLKLSGTQSLRVTANTDHAEEGAFYFEFSAENAAQTMSVALRNCL